MSLREAVRIALRGLRANRLRSALTMLIIGVAALQSPGRAPDIISVTPASTGQTVAETASAEARTSIVGSTERWLEVNNRELQAGLFFDEAQVRSAARVVVLGPTAVDKLFGSDPADALGQTIRINRQTFKVIGVTESVGEPGDNQAIMPLNTARRYIFGGGDVINQIIVQATDAAAVPAARAQVTDILSDRHRIKDPAQRDFEVHPWVLGSTPSTRSSTSSPYLPSPSRRSR